MHAWTDGYEISEVNKSKTKKKNRKNRLSTFLPFVFAPQCLSCST